MLKSDESNTKGSKSHISQRQPFTKVPAFDNPCLKEQEMSFKCLADNNYDKDKCSLEFANYKACKEFWRRVFLDRRAKGIYPLTPPPEERVHIKEEYMKNKNWR